MPNSLKTALWLAWAAAAVVFTAGIVRWHVEYFRSPGPQFFRAAIAGISLLAVAVCIWPRLRAAFLWRHELVAIVAVPAAIALLREPRATMVIAALLAGCYCSGQELCRRCGWATREMGGSPAADLVFSLAAGFALLNTALFVGGIARMWYLPVFAALMLGPVVLFPRHLWNLLRTTAALFRRWTEFKELTYPLPGVMILFAAILAICTTVLMISPTLSWDAMKMHLPLSQYYVQVHALEPKPELDYSFFPQAAESLFALAWSLGGQPAAQLIGPVFFALSLMASWIVARDCGANPAETLTGVVLAASLPILHWAASVPKNDSAVTFFLLTSLAAALRWRATNEFRWVQAGALFLASAFATKDLAAFGAVPLGVLFLASCWSQPRRFRAIASLGIILAVVALIWNVRRFALTGNPISPLAPGKSIFPGWPPDPSWSGTLLRIFRVPWDLHFHGRDFSETVLIAPIGIAFAVFWPVWLFTARPKRAERVCLWFAMSSFVLWAWLTPLVRYALPALTVFALFTGVRMVRFWQASPLVVRVSLGATAFWVMIAAVCGAMIVEINAPQLRYTAGIIGREEYLSQALTTYPSLAWLRDHTASSERILGLENCSDVYAPAFPRYRSVCEFRPWTAAEIRSQLSRMHFDFLVAPAASPPPGPSALETFRDANFVVYRLN